MKLTFRQGALLKLVAGGILYAGVFYGTMITGDFLAPDTGTLYIIALVAPGALAMIGVIELWTDRPFEDVAALWDALPGWKKALFSVGTVLAAIIVVFGPLLLIGWIRDG